MQEKTIENYLVRQVLAKGGWAIKLTSPNAAGLPDRLILLPGGVVIFAELKRPGGSVRPLQKSAHRRLRELGFVVYTIDSKDGVDDVLASFRSGGR